MWWIVLIVVGALILLGVIWYIACANNFVRLKNNIDEAFDSLIPELENLIRDLNYLRTIVKGGDLDA